MAIPKSQALKLPLLRFLGDGAPRTTGDAEEYLAKFFELSADDVRELLPSKKQPRFRSRISDAASQCKQAMLIEPVARGVFRITERGRELLVLPADEVTPNNAATTRVKARRSGLERALQEQNKELCSQLLARVKECSQLTFEQIVLDLLVAMGYGGPRANAGSRLGRSEDGRIEGLIKGNKLGHPAIYFEAARWTVEIDLSIVEAFLAVMDGVGAPKGAIITTSDFSDDARAKLLNAKKNVLAIDGTELAHMMVHHNIGVVEELRVVIKRVSPEYFSER